MCESNICSHEEEYNHLKEVIEQATRNARRIWEWMPLSDQRAVLYEYPDMAAWVKDNLERG